MSRIRIRSLLILALLFLTPSLAFATTIISTPIDLPDTTPGVDLWQYQYTLVDFPTPTANYGFTIYFDETLYADLSNPTAPTGWDSFVGQPVALPSPPASGIYDELALIDGASLSPFSVDFTWLGTGTPGHQPFDIYSYDVSSNTVTTLETGETVPEPATAVLLVSGLAALPWARRWMRRRG